MTDQDLKHALVDAAFALGGTQGWSRVSPAAAAAAAGIELAQARAVFGCNAAILKTFGQQADRFALVGMPEDGSVRDKLFDIILRRFDYLQAHRAGVLALMRYLPLCPPLALALAEMNIASMGWLLEAVGISATGLAGAVRKRGLLVVWLYALRAWSNDESPDMTATMAAVDEALKKAETIAGRFGWGAKPEGQTLDTHEPSVL